MGHPAVVLHAKVYIVYVSERGFGAMTNRRRMISSIFVPIFVGLIGMFNVTRYPRFADIRSVDVVQLVASGMCFGVALVSIIALFRNSRTN